MQEDAASILQEDKNREAKKKQPGASPLKLQNEQGQEDSKKKAAPEDTREKVAPAEDSGVKKKKTPADKKKMPRPSFSVGVRSSTKKSPGRSGEGRVKEAKRKLELQMRKEKRDSVLELTRKAILTTPNSKRKIGDEESWGTPASPSRTGTSPAPRTPALACRRFQTPIQAFLVSQSKEERRKLLELDTTVRLDNLDMSASPNLKKRKKRLLQPGKKTSTIRKTVSSKPGMVARIANYFESAEMKDNTAGSSHTGAVQHNNNVLSRPQTSQTETVSVSNDPEMAVMAGAGGAQPMGRGYLGHMTSEPRQ